MSSTVLKHAFACASFAIVNAAVAAKGAQPLLSCETQKAELTALKQAPHGARRVSKHILVVTLQNGSQQFVDKPPHDDDGSEMGGVRWRYCGYNADAKAHLIEMTDESAYSGDLLLGDTGKLLHAGHTVLFSPKRQAFLAIKQEAGVDGENWTVSDMTGKTLWKGYAGTTTKVEGIDMVVSTFERPRWTQQGELTARYVCASSKTDGAVTLAQSSSGSWSWRGHGKCL
jgi:hypothetical protein